MTPEERSLLERTYKISEENNTILKSLRRSNRIAAGIKIFYWIVIIGISVGAFYFIQPYVDFMKDTFTGGGNGSESADASQSQLWMNNLQELLK